MTDPANDVPERERRSSVILRALVETSDAAIECRVRNLSASGACIDNEAELATGARVLVSMGTLHHLRGQVVWATERLAGLRFDKANIDIDSARKPRGTVAKTSPAGAGWLAQLDDPHRRRPR
ncbi:PilZ domain-containing protein [Sphingomonas sp. Leaf4]|uniref:PilZ domain-containing protein n=1 Tax=Sphingomonas sp. Leaf4 TaxID=2876553 RepID=UPI001E4586A9|nr:PilZ domain-containing protein [Sphingomonas sp. Leaf4]